jgi:hypothetical protein
MSVSATKAPRSLHLGFCTGRYGYHGRVLLVIARIIPEVLIDIPRPSVSFALFLMTQRETHIRCVRISVDGFLSLTTGFMEMHHRKYRYTRTRSNAVSVRGGRSIRQTAGSIESRVRARNTASEQVELESLRKKMILKSFSKQHPLIQRHLLRSIHAVR